MKTHSVSLLLIGHNIQILRPGHGISLTQHKCRFSTYSHGRYDQMTWHNGDDQVSRLVVLHGPTKFPRRNSVSATSPKINMFPEKGSFQKESSLPTSIFPILFPGISGSKGSCQQKYISPSYTGLSFASIFWSVAWWSNNDNPPSKDRQLSWWETNDIQQMQTKEEATWILNTEHRFSLVMYIHIYIYKYIDHKYDAPNMSAAHVEQRSNDLLYVQFNKLSLYMCHQARLELWTPQNSSWKLEVTRLKRKRIF